MRKIRSSDILRKRAQPYMPQDYAQRRRCRYCLHTREEHSALPYFKGQPIPNRPPFAPMVSPGQKMTNQARCTHKNPDGATCQCSEFIE